MKFISPPSKGTSLTFKCKVGITVIWLLLGAVLGYLFLVIAFCLPTNRMRSHLESTPDVFYNGSVALVKDDLATHLDYLTEATILSEAIYDGNESPFVKAAAIYSVLPPEGDENWSYRKLISSLSATNESAHGPYDRYWQGQLAILRPLLLLLDYKDILRLNTLVQLFLMLWIAHLLSCHSLTHLLFPLALMFCSLTPIATGICLQYTPCFLIMAIGCVVLLRHTNIINKFNWLFFLSLGMATSYFDFLTYPLVTLGIPLILYLQLETSSPSQRFFQITTCSLSWSIGYIGFWAEKWLLGSVILQENLFSEAYNSIILRSSHETLGQTITYMATLKNNLQAYDLRTWKILWLLLFLVTIVLALHRHCLTLHNILAFSPLCLVACMPFVWYYFTQNHSYIHFGFTHRELSITFFALSCFLVQLCNSAHIEPKQKI